MDYKKLNAIIYALLAALFYAINIPCSKLLLNNVPPTFMAAFLYMGAGLGVGIMYIFHAKKESTEERLGREDIPYTFAMVVLDIIAPILLMIGIKLGTAANASLLGNFEIVATTLIAFGLFREKVSARLRGAISLITVASIILSFSGEGSFFFSLGSVFVLGATVCWGLENNCTRKISGKSTYEIVTIKGIGSGTGSFIVAMVLGENIPRLSYIGIIMILGFVAYGLSIFTYIRAQKTLGAAKTSAYYAVAPFIGVVMSAVFLKERFTMLFIIALIIMITGTVLIVRDTLIHSHKHAHTHLITHTHDGSTHTHAIEHSHDHTHVIKEGKHGHTHSVEELETALGHRGAL
ncbi:Permease of the drug/metabolite transporter (DMT) superfamily [Butyrivibrio sp. ob235]|uniref:DMT family transporter n=1 Tax=Butyrivibrio sp. ob235 TaxID=1761780 RepID=UPI0008B59D87|nr:DMT family transporter [Butyrivibrio sp. ob235]SEM68688.1 Permease of the drug/metabolite transporter (DMT) superfamily [Butyrivibrio sp. ob235]